MITGKRIHPDIQNVISVFLVEIAHMILFDIFDLYDIVDVSMNLTV